MLRTVEGAGGAAKKSKRMDWIRHNLKRLPLRWVFEALYLSSSDPWRYWHSEFEKERHSDAVRLIQRTVPHPETILEVGCSVGAFSRHLIALSPQMLTAVDISALALRRARQALEHARGVTRLHLMCADIFSDPIPVRDCDLVVAMDVLGYTDDFTVLAATCDRLIAALSPGGTLLVGNTKLALQDGEGFAPFPSGFPRLGARSILECLSARATIVDGFEGSHYRLDLLRPS